MATSSGPIHVRSRPIGRRNQERILYRRTRRTVILLDDARELKDHARLEIERYRSTCTRDGQNLLNAEIQSDQLNSLENRTISKDRFFTGLDGLGYSNERHNRSI